MVNERHAIRIQAVARGKRDRFNTARMKRQEEAATLIQKYARAKLARRRLEDIKRQVKVITLFANAERKAVMKLQVCPAPRCASQRACVRSPPRPRRPRGAPDGLLPAA